MLNCTSIVPRFQNTIFCRARLLEVRKPLSKVKLEGHQSPVTGSAGEHAVVKSIGNAFPSGKRTTCTHHLHGDAQSIYRTRPHANTSKTCLLIFSFIKFIIKFHVIVMCLLAMPRLIYNATAGQKHK